ncbi:MAG: hypothetical protein CMN76_12620 [Spirochaetaceae bacterium]|nr:hypothetical protein [Spirochaetaceae bacterium]
MFFGWIGVKEKRTPPIRSTEDGPLENISPGHLDGDRRTASRSIWSRNPDWRPAVRTGELERVSGRPENEKK